MQINQKKSMNCVFVPSLLLLTISTLKATTTFTAVNYGAASANEQAAFDAINDFRADPTNELYEIMQADGYGGTKASFDTLLNAQGTHSAGWWEANVSGSLLGFTLDFFGVVPGTLNGQFAGLTAESAYTWNDNIGWSAHQYSQWVVDDGGATGNPHAIPGAPSLGDRFTEAGVTWTGVGENIARDFTAGVAYQHAGFVIDWGSGAGSTDGIQDPAGHRNTMMSDSFTDLGIAYVDSYTDDKITQVQHFAAAASSGSIAYGYVSLLGGGADVGVTVEVLDASNGVIGTATTDAKGAYTAEVTGTAASIRFTDSDGKTVTSSAFGSSNGNHFLDVMNVPEPSSTFLLGLGSLVLFVRRRS